MHPVLQAENKEQFETELELQVHLDQQRYLRSLSNHLVHISVHLEFFSFENFSGCFPPGLVVCSVGGGGTMERERLRVSLR